MNEICDMCGTPIEDGKCSCGSWHKRDETDNHPYLQALNYFHEQKVLAITADIPHLGCGVLFFRGDYRDCKELEEHFYKMKKRPFYSEEN